MFLVFDLVVFACRTDSFFFFTSSLGCSKRPVLSLGARLEEQNIARDLRTRKDIGIVMKFAVEPKSLNKMKVRNFGLSKQMFFSSILCFTVNDSLSFEMTGIEFLLSLAM